MTALFFGSTERRLFGVHHRATAGSSARHAVLLCYPGLQEYNTAHWVFRRLAGMLERAGHDVLRFDYFATGDSAGEGSEGRVGIWVENVAQAATELREISGARSLSVVGMRLGGALALRACVTDLRVRTLVLWEPVVSGAAYLDELEMLDRRRNLWLLHADRLSTPKEELLGYRFAPEVRTDILSLDALSVQAPQAERVVIVAEQARESYDRLGERLVAHGVSAAVRVVKEDGVMTEGGQRERAKLSHAVLVEIVNQIGQGTR